jgi:hypothetical protein
VVLVLALALALLALVVQLLPPHQASSRQVELLHLSQLLAEVPSLPPLLIAFCCLRP